jgi:hypothetical protein
MREPFPPPPPLEDPDDAPPAARNVLRVVVHLPDHTQAVVPLSGSLAHPDATVADLVDVAGIALGFRADAPCVCFVVFFFLKKKIFIVVPVCLLLLPVLLGSLLSICTLYILTRTAVF